MQQIRRLQRAPGLRVATDYGFAAFWLMPRVARFRSKYPEVDVRITASSMLQPLDRREADISILFGGREDFPKDAALFIGEKVTPVCSSAFLAAHGPFPEGKGLGSTSLLHLDALQGIAGLPGAPGSIRSEKILRRAIMALCSTPTIW